MRLRHAFAAIALALAGCEEAPPPVAPPQPPPPPTADPAAPADPAPVTDGDVTVAFANGVKILVKRTPGVELAAMTLYVRGGAHNWGAADAGVERLALSVAAAGGTKQLDRDTFARRLAALGSEIGAECRLDGSALRAKSLGSKWDDTFAMLAAAFLEPALPAGEIELQRAKQIAELRREQENPDAQIGPLLNRALFAGHPFQNRAIGTLETVEKLDAAALAAHLGKLRETSRLLFVTVGDVDPAHVIEKVKATLGQLPRGGYEEKPFPAIAFDKAAVSVTEKKLATNYIVGAFPAPGWGAADQGEAMVAMNLLGHRLFEEVRTKRNLSYAPHAGLSLVTSRPHGYLYVTAVDPGTTIRVFHDEVRKLQAEPVGDKELAGTKATYLTEYLMRNETVDGQAAMLADAELLGGDWKLARTLPERIRAVTPAGVQAYAKKYLQHLQTVVLGDSTKIDKALFTSL
jgi:zinc protease